MQARKTGLAERRDPRDSQHETVAYCGPQLEELIAASAEVPALAYDSDTRVDVACANALRELEESEASEAHEESDEFYEEVSEGELDVPIESTVVMAGLRAPSVSDGTVVARLAMPRPFFPPPPPSPPRRQSSIFPTSATPSSIVALVTDVPSVPPPAISYAIASDDPEPSSRFRPSTRVAYAISVAVLGMMCGGIFTTSLADDDAASAAPLPRPDVRTREDQKTGWTGSVREKAMKPLPIRRR